MPEISGYVDAHLHLQDPRLREASAEVLRDAPRLGIASLWVNATSPDDWESVLSLARQSPLVTPFLGVHPWFVANSSVSGEDWASRLEVLLQNNPAAAIGEAGLDRWLEPRDEALQERVFLRQIELACRYARPLCVHCLRAWDWLAGLLKRGPVPGFMLHSFGGSPEILKQMLERGAYVSFSASAFRPEKERAREVLRRVPADRLLIETDAPDMPLPDEIPAETLRSPEGEAVNSPLNLPLIYQMAAAERGVAVEELCEQVAQNARRFLLPLKQSE